MTDALRDETPEPAGARSRYSHGAMLLHWLIAACFVFQIGLGLRMDGPRGPETFAVFQLHKSIGITILFLTLIRLGWRLMNPAPPFPATMSVLEKRLAHIVHVGFYVLLLGLPLTGWLLVSASKTAVPTFLFGTVPWPHVPGVPGLAPATKAVFEEASEFGHHALVYTAYLLLFLHVAGALKHQFFDRGDDLARMLPAPRRALGGTALAVIAVLAGLFFLGNTVRLRPIALAGASSPPPVTEPAPAAAPIPSASPTAPATPVATPTPEASATPDAEPAKAVLPSTWTVRRAASTLGFRTSWSQGKVDGHFGSWNAAILFDPDALDASSVKVTIDMTTGITGVDDTEQALIEDDWFATATHPTATYSATKFRHIAGDRYQAIGTLALRGVSRPLTLPFTLSIAGDVATMTGSATIDRTVFGVGQGEWKATTDLPASVAVTVSIKADRAK